MLPRLCHFCMGSRSTSTPADFGVPFATAFARRTLLRANFRSQKKRLKKTLIASFDLLFSVLVGHWTRQHINVEHSILTVSWWKWVFNRCPFLSNGLSGSRIKYNRDICGHKGRNSERNERCDRVWAKCVDALNVWWQKRRTQTWATNHSGRFYLDGFRAEKIQLRSPFEVIFCIYLRNPVSSRTEK